MPSDHPCGRASASSLNDLSRIAASPFAARQLGPPDDAGLHPRCHLNGTERSSQFFCRPFIRLTPPEEIERARRRTRSTWPGSAFGGRR